MSAELRVELRPEGHLLVEGAGEQRRLAFDLTLIERWSERYAQTRPEHEQTLHGFGEALFAGLEGAEPWLADALSRATGLEFVTRDDSRTAHAFLDLPWELLRGPSGWLASDALPISRRVLTTVDTLGEAGAPPSRHRLFVLFMASAPLGIEGLNYEWEEQRILRATAGGRAERGIDLIVEETGTLDALDRRLALEDGAVGQVAPDVLHLSCFGKVGMEGEPLLSLEDALGHEDAVDASRLAAALSARPPRLVFASACYTASSPHSTALTRSLVDAGIDAALGWAGDITDASATEAASELYAALADAVPLELAVARARRALLRAARPDWHRLRLYLGPRGGGAMLRASEQPSRLRGPSRSRGEPPTFVGRRRTLQRVLRALRAGEPVLIHGLAGIGKSILAEQIAERLSGHALAWLTLQSDDLDGSELLTALEAMDREAASPSSWRRLARAGQLDLSAALEDLLGARSAQGVPDPVLLVLDDLEQLLDDEGHMSSTSAARLASLVDAFRTRGKVAKLLLISRRALAIVDPNTHQRVPLTRVPLPSMTTLELRKLAMRLHLGLLPVAVLERSLEAAAGNPSLMRSLIELAVKDTSAWDRQSAALLAWRRGDLQALTSSAEEHLDRAGIEAMLARLTPSQRATLESFAVFEIPIPSAVELGSEADVTALVALSLVESREDVRHEHERVLVLSPLVRPLVLPPALDTQSELTRRHVAALLDHWSGERPLAVDEELLRIGRLAGDARAVHSGADAVLAALHQAGRYREGADLAGEVLALLDEAEYQLSPLLRWKAAEHLASVGEPARALALVAASIGLVPGPLEVHAGRLWFIGRVALSRGELHEAKSALEHSIEALDEIPDSHAAAVVAGDLAQLRWILGHTRDAIALHHDRLGVFEWHGDQQAQIAALEQRAEQDLSRMDTEKAAAFLGRALAFHELAGDTRARALTLTRIARERGLNRDYEGALHQLGEALGVFEDLGDAQARALTLVEIGRMHGARGEHQRALEIHRELAAEFERRGERRSLAIACGDIARTLLALGQADEASRLFHEELTTYEEIGDPRARALALVDLAGILAKQGDLDDALGLLRESLEVFTGLDDRRALAIALADLARLSAARGQRDEALEYFDQSAALFAELEMTRERELVLRARQRVA